MTTNSSQIEKNQGLHVVESSLPSDFSHREKQLNPSNEAMIKLKIENVFQALESRCIEKKRTKNPKNCCNYTSGLQIKNYATIFGDMSFRNLITQVRDMKFAFI